MRRRRALTYGGQRQASESSGEEDLVVAAIATAGEGAHAGAMRTKRFAAFLSHFKVECGTEARLVQLELNQQLPAREIFLDSGPPYGGNS